MIARLTVALPAMHVDGLVALLVAFLGMVGLAHDACRFVLTEGCLTRLQQLIASSGTLSSRSRVPGLDSGQRPALSERSPATVLDQPVVDQLRGVR
jgi:hypothetical protein